MNAEIQVIYFYDTEPRFGEAITRKCRMALNQFFSFCEKPFDQIVEADIQEWLDSMEERGFQAHTVRTNLAAVQLFYHYCMDENKLKRNPSLSFKLDKKIEEWIVPSFGQPVIEDTRLYCMYQYKKGEPLDQDRVQKKLSKILKDVRI